MLLQKSCQNSLKLTNPITVNQTHSSLIYQQRLVEKPFRPRDGFVDGAADDVQIGDGRFTRMQVEVNLDTACGCRRRTGNHAQIPHARAHSLATDVELRGAVV